MKDFRVTKIVKEIKFDEITSELEASKAMLPERIIHKIFETNSIFNVK